MQHSDASSLPIVDELSPLLATERFGRPVRGYESVDSTNTVAAAWAAEGAPEGAVVLAEFQTRGRGRQGRIWKAAPGKNLTFSVILRPPLPPHEFGLITVAGSLAVAEAVEEVTAPHRPVIKWPNDILLDGRKCCGMLLESAFSSPADGRSAVVVIGVGMNVNETTFPPSLEDTATSLLLTRGRPVPRAPLLATLLQHLERRYDELITNGGMAICQAYETRMAGLGRPTMLRFAHRDERVDGTILGLSEAGALRVKTDHGVEVYHAGEVTTHVS